MTKDAIEDELLVAYVDGALDAATHQRLAAREAVDADFRARAEAYRALRQQLRQAFDPVLDEPVPDRLRQAALADDKVIAFRPAKAWLTQWAKPAMAMAASLVVGLYLGGQWYGSGGGPFKVRDTGLYAGDALAASLNSRLSGQAGDGDGAAILLSFRSAENDYCRVFQLDQASLAGLACMEGAAWHIASVQTAALAGDNAGMQPAGAEALPPALRASIAARIAGDALGLEEEKAARAAGWQKPAP
ncbi:MAG: anti-sigma factor [Sphingomonadales bacterium]